MYLVGVTGGIGSGKSTVCNLLFEEHGVPFIYVDKISREIVQPGMPLTLEIKAKFGKQAMLEDGNINRAYLRNLIINNPDAKKLVDSTFEPHMKKEIERKLDILRGNGAKLAGIESAMIFEFGMEDFYDEVVAVSCNPETQIRRVMERDNQTERAAKGIIALQMPLSEKEKRADRVIMNDGSFSGLKEKVAQLYKELRKSI